MTIVTTKRCPTCGKYKAAADFYADLHQPSGLSAYCRSCTRERRRAEYAAELLDAAKHARRLASHMRYELTDKGKAARQRAKERWAQRQRDARAREANRAYVNRCGPHVI